MSIERVFENAAVRAFHQPGEGDTLIVSFNPLTYEGDGQSFWGSDFFLKEGLPALGFDTIWPNWFPGGWMAPAVAAARAITARYRIVITYGQSMGAYAALKYSAALGATHTLAFSPQWSIDPADVGAFDRRYDSYFDAALHAGMRIGPSDIGGAAFTLFDPVVLEDRGHVDRIGLGGRVLPVIVPFTGHETVRAVIEGHGIRPMFDLCAASGGDAAALGLRLRQAARTARARSALYHQSRAQRVQSWLAGAAVRRWTQEMHVGRYRRAIEAVSRALAYGDDDPFLHLAAVQAWIASNELERAARVLDYAERLPGADAFRDRFDAFRATLAAAGVGT